MADLYVLLRGTTLSGEEGTRGELIYHDDKQDDGIVAGLLVDHISSGGMSLMLTLDEATKLRDALNVTIRANGGD